MRLILSITVCIIMLCLSSPAMAYIGPGLGAGTFAVILGFIGSVIMALFAVLWYPFKRLIQKLKTTKKGNGH